ncbi:MAG: MG2 domain-containing protein, partial [Chthoniobacterales bacterium]
IRYKVSISNRIVGDPGYTLPKPETWGATFQSKKPTVLFPEGVLRQRAALGLRFALLQANTGPITWKLAAIPLDRLQEVRTAMNDDTSKILVDEFHLGVVAQDEIAASDNDREQVRPIEWKPAAGQPALSGPYLIEAVAKTAGNGAVVNRSLIFFNEIVFTQKTMSAGTQLRLARMGDGEPIAGANVKLVTATLSELAHATTDKFGVAEFPAASLVGSAFFLADNGGAQAVELSAPGAPFSDTGSSYFRPAPQWLGRVVTDRPLYRPGEEIHFKGMLRRNENDRLSIPPDTQVSWQITGGDRDEHVAEGTAKTNAFGGWDAAWTSPPQGKLGDFRISTKIGDTEVGYPESFQIQEFRNPSFSVVCETPDQTKAANATVNVSSQYFHGAPNVGSAIKWTATWISDSDGEYYSDEDADGFVRVDLYSEHRKTPAFEMEVTGETALDAKGRATITSDAPFKDPGLRANSDVLWRVDVTGPDGQTITGGAEQKIAMNDVTLGVRADSESGKKDIAFDLQAISRDKSQKPPAEVQAALFLVQTKSVKERIAPFVYRYRNSDKYVPIEKKNVPANGHLAFTPKEPGRYVLVVSPLSGQSGITVSDEIYLSGNGEAQLPVKSDEKLEIKSVAKDKPAPVGTNAAFDVLTSSPGIAWVTVET